MPLYFIYLFYLVSLIQFIKYILQISKIHMYLGDVKNILQKKLKIIFSLSKI
jgi:hypothetical protein